MNLFASHAYTLLFYCHSYVNGLKCNIRRIIDSPNKEVQFFCKLTCGLCLCLFFFIYLFLYEASGNSWVAFKMLLCWKSRRIDTAEYVFTSGLRGSRSSSS